MKTEANTRITPETAPGTVETRLGVCSLVIERLRCAVPHSGGHGTHTTVISREHEPMVAALCAAIAPHLGGLRITFEDHPMVMRNRLVKAKWEKEPRAGASGS